MSLYYSSSIDYISGKSYNNKIGYQYADVDDQSNCDTPDGPPNNENEKIIPNSEEPLFIKEAVQVPIEVVSLLSEDLKACSNNSSENDDAFSPSTPPSNPLHNDLFHGTAEIASQSSASQLIGVLFKKCKENNLSLDYDISCYDLRVAEDDYTVDNDIPQLDLSNSIISFGVDKFVLCPVGTSVPVIEITILPITQMDSIETISIQYSILDTYKKSPLKDLSNRNIILSESSSTNTIIKTNSISSSNSSNSNDNNNNNNNNSNNNKKGKHKRHSSFLPSRPQWLPNSASSQCMYPGCRMTFSIISLNRRHHCRCCGKLYCTDHSKYQIKLPSLGYNTPQRVCKICYENCTKGYVDADIKSFEKQASQTPPPIVDNECIVCRFEKKPIGLKLESDVYGRNARVSGFERSSEGQVFNAESDGRIKIGQYILSINGQSTIGLKFNQILDFVQDSICPIEIRLGGLSPEILQQYDLNHKVSLSPPVWVPDESAPECMFETCHNEFSKSLLDFKYRRHHCRSCGKIFCSKHCYKKILLTDFGYIGPQRVCNTCYNMHTASDENSFCYNNNGSASSSQEKQLGQRGSLDSCENSRCSALGCSKVFDSLFHGGEVKYFCTCCDRPFCAEHVKRKMCLPKRNIFQEVNVCDQCYYQQMGDSDLESYCLPVTNLDTGQTFLLHEVLSQTNRTNPSNPIV